MKIHNRLAAALLLATTAFWPADARAEGQPTILPCTFSQPSCRPAYGLTVTYRWDAQPMGHDYKAFVHIRDAKGHMAFQADYELQPAPRTGPVAWSRRAPTSFPATSRRATTRS